MSLKLTTTIAWGERFPLRDVFSTGQVNPAPERIGGVYMWGYDANDEEIIWYVGSANRFRTRLRQHYLSLMSCQYQIPKGFLKGIFKEPVINHRHKAVPNHIQVAHVLSPGDPNWLHNWRIVHNSLVKQSVIKCTRGGV